MSGTGTTTTTIANDGQAVTANRDGPSNTAGVNVPTSSPAGPGVPLDGGDAVNTYETPADQAADVTAGNVDWQDKLQSEGEAP